MEHHVFSLSMLHDDTDTQQHGEASKTTPLPVLPSVKTLKLLGCSRGIVHPVFVQKLAQSLPNLATLHFDRTALPGRQSPAFAVDHLVLTNLPYKLERNPVPWLARRLTYVLAGPNADHNYFSLARCRIDLSPMLCLSISAPVIAPRTWDDLLANKWEARLLELESSITSFSEVVAPLVRISLPDPLSILSLTPTTFNCELQIDHPATKALHKFRCRASASLRASWGFLRTPKEPGSGRATSSSGARAHIFPSSGTSWSQP